MRIHVTATEAIPGIPIGQHNASVKDIIQAIFEVTFSAHHVPWGIVIDDPEHLYTLFELLNPFRLSVSYKPPISAENKSVEEDNSRKRCVVCLCTTCPNGRSLLRCSKCQKVFYCSVDHQTQHWKAHKIHCT